MKYNLIQAKTEGLDTLLTFGGAFSNHIAAVACSGNEHGFKTIGVIRGEELQQNASQNPTLQLASEQGMRFHFVTREMYRKKAEPKFLEDLKRQFGAFYHLPEGGSNPLAVKGCEEILTDEDDDFDVIGCSVGTGATLAGLINSAGPHQKVFGFPALKGDFVMNSVRKFANNENWKLVDDYHFGGYAKVNRDLVDFINDFRQQTGVPLDPLYSGKLFFGVLDMIKRGMFRPKTKILLVHTGGLQGIFGMNAVLKKKNLPLINL